MKSLKNVVQEVLRDTLYETDVVMRSDRSKRITLITDNLRGVCGITVITLSEPARPISETVEKTLLKVKFFRLGGSLKEHLRTMSLEARKIDGVYSFIPREVRKVQSKIYTK